MFSEKTLYNYIDAGLFSARNIDLPRKVIYKPCKSSHDSFKVDKSCHIGRTYQDFLDFISGCPDCPTVQTDSVFMIFESLYSRLGSTLFKEIFPLLLTDNGNEFSDPISIEMGVRNELRTRIFYCNPLAPYQKGATENNPEFIR